MTSFVPLGKRKGKRLKNVSQRIYSAASIFFKLVAAQENKQGFVF